MVAPQKKVFIIANPKAGSMDVDQFTEDLAGVFAESNHTYKLHFTQPDEEVAATLNKAIQDGWDVIAAAGGDGTVSMVADSLQGLDIPLGILPMGTGNVLAQELGIPQELGQAADLILGEHKRRPVDGMKIQDHIYLLYIGAGISSAIMEDASQQSKRRFGQVAYVWAGLKKLAGWQPVHFKLEIDGRKLSSSAIEIGVTNTRIAGGKLFEWGEDIAVDDNCVLVCIVRSKSLLDYIQIFFDLLLGRTNRSKRIRCFEAQDRIKIGAATALKVEADGELVGETPVEIAVIPHAVTIIVPLD
jgi:YegS/Rv2252/BmrU family lipid kinase